MNLVRHIRRDICNRMVQIVLVTGQPGYAPQREVVTDYESGPHYSAVIRDISDRKRSESGLRLAASVYAYSYEVCWTCWAN